jgi:hypothetical protein
VHAKNIRAEFAQLVDLFEIAVMQTLEVHEIFVLRWLEQHALVSGAKPKNTSKPLKTN